MPKRAIMPRYKVRRVKSLRFVKIEAELEKFAHLPKNANKSPKPLRIMLKNINIYIPPKMIVTAITVPPMAVKGSTIGLNLEV